MTANTTTARSVTKALRALFPAPITLRTTVNPSGELEVILGRGAANHHGAHLTETINRATEGQWAYAGHVNLRGGCTTRLTYTRLRPAATFDKIGQPHEWPLGQADEDTVAARHAAVAATGTPTGATAQPDQLVVHIELGTPGVFSHLGDTDDSIAYVRFANEVQLDAVHPDDVVVLTTNLLWCDQADLHPDHGEAVSPECLLPTPDQELIGPELLPSAKWRHELHAADGVEVWQNSDGTWWALARTSCEVMSICSSQPTLAATYRSINRYRQEMAGRVERDHAQALRIVAARQRLAEADTAVAAAGAAQQAAAAARMPGNFEANLVNNALTELRRAQLHLQLAEGKQPGRSRLVIVESSKTDGTAWKFEYATINDATAHETAAAHARRFASDNYLTRDPHRVHVFTDPDAAAPDGEWTNLLDPCPPGQHDSHVGRVIPGARRDDGSTVQASRCRVCMHLVWRVKPVAGEPYPWVLEGEDLPPAEPGVLYLPLAGVTTDHYGMEINDGNGVWQVLDHVGRFDPQTGMVNVTAAGRTTPMGGGTMVQLRPAHPESGPDDGRHATPTPTPTPTPTGGADGGSGLDGAGRGLGPRVALRYRLSAQTDGRWRPVQTGETPPGFLPSRSDCDMVADTVLDNARCILGLSPDQPMPAVRVQTWHWPTGVTGQVSRPAQRS